ncbi:uncharacterized protein LOC126273155 [Schistocerca gregaria]|uniref:uncharacterized protein LOC126273155 n=1 Tax=Schistocerca gregaria TaxID=7010 RepID=UPI00211F130E|nr:uncharacterized protein LOC126273155 [Schistocerca gregaria]
MKQQQQQKWLQGHADTSPQLWAARRSTRVWRRPREPAGVLAAAAATTQAGGRAAAVTCSGLEGTPAPAASARGVSVAVLCGQAAASSSERALAGGGQAAPRFAASAVDTAGRPATLAEARARPSAGGRQQAAGCGLRLPPPRSRLTGATDSPPFDLRSFRRRDTTALPGSARCRGRRLLPWWRVCAGPLQADFC